MISPVMQLQQVLGEEHCLRGSAGRDGPLGRPRK